MTHTCVLGTSILRLEKLTSFIVVDNIVQESYGSFRKQVE